MIKNMNYIIFFPVILMVFTVNPANAIEPFSVKAKPISQIVSLSHLPIFKYGGRPGYYFTIKAFVTNRDIKTRVFMVDDDCTFASWKLIGKPLEILGESCRKNIFDNVSLPPGKSYSTNLKIWLPKSYSESRIKFKIGFVEIIDYKIVSGPYWSDDISISIIK